MKITCVQLVLAVVFAGLTLARNGMAQELLNRTISVQLENRDLRTVLNRLEKAANVKFTYVPQLISAQNKVSLRAENDRLEVVLTRLLKPLNITYQVSGNYIVLKKEPTSAVLPDEQPMEAPDLLAELTVAGTVTDEKGEGLPGVSVLLKGTQRGTATDSKGAFRLAVPDNSAVLVFSFVGYQSQEIAVGSQSTLTVRLEADEKSLNEVVVVGYGTVKRSDLTGSVAKVGEESIKATPIVALDRAMQGRAAGVLVTTNSAKPGGGTTIRIRGTGSVNAGNDPLYVIDGFPTGNLNSINPNDIESLEILKDASATAIYGSRGSNGVVMITTKRGKEGQSGIAFESYYGVQSVRRKIPMLNAREYAEFVNEARVNGGAKPYFDGSTASQPLPETLGEGTNWQDEVFRSAPIQSYQLSFTGGETKTRYAISGSYYDQQGIILNSYFKRFTLRANLDREVKKWLKIGLSMQGAHTRSNSSRTETDGGAAGGVTNAAINYAPVFPILNANGTYYRDQSSLNGSLVDNPVGLANEVTDRYNTIRLLSNVFADIKLWEGLTFRTSWGADLFNSKSNYYATRLIALGASTNGSASITDAQSLGWLNENTLTYARTLAEKHNLTALLGYTTQGYHNESVTASAINFNDDFALYNNLSGGATLQTPASGAADWALISYLARVNYGYDSRFLLTLTARRDGSSRFGPNNKYGFFPSGALAWRVINEKFMQDRKWVSDLKLRVSYGLTGNQEIGDYRYLSNINVSTAALGGATTILRTGGIPGIISNLDLRWEKNAQLDAGVDLALFNNRVQLTADYYIKTTSDLLFSVNVPQTTGYSTSLRNIGKVENRGLELALSTINIDRGGFRWNTEFNIAFNKNKILALDGRPEFTSGDGSGHLQVSNTVLMKVGEPLGNFYGRVVEGIFQNQAEIDGSAQKTAKPGDLKYRDINGDGVINDNDRTVIGNGYPTFFGGINNTLSFRGFDLNIFLQGSSGNEIMNYGRFDQYSLNGNSNQAKEVLNRWTPTNPSNDIPRANSTGGQRILSTFHIEDGSYLRVKNLSLGYNLPVALLKRMTFQSAKVYVSAQNLITFTNYKGYDPEVSRFGSTSISQGMDYGGYPAAKTVLVGLNLKF
ncbi:TonB-dependent receptor [Larkinella rosea]|uniref:SusC/RagA family TonB-linked outer membrane protein n=1 Tax=Larkinella rosea TaxID=2025312 RepID=A0A3P1BED3_9BACT|nr:TonB-dependent receptor [Larkinella rosea]RRA99242.1 SusC/RagA family TonB-linked outer membrane protein [Larkinella rosea]